MLAFGRALSRWAPLRRMAGALGAFRRDQRGGVAVLVAAAIVPLVGALGLATDTARGYMVKARLSQALDAAALAGGKSMFSADRDSIVQMYFDANFPSNFMNARVSNLVIVPNDDKTTLDVSATATINTTFMRVLGFETLTVSAATQVTREVDQLDLVLSIDTSGSMGQPMSKIEGAREAAKDLVDILFGANEVSPTITVEGTTYNLLNIGVVNWNSKVNVTVEGPGKVAFDSGATTVQSVPSFTNPVTGATQNELYFANNSPVPLLAPPQANWSGCVYARYTGNSVSGSSTGNSDDADLYLGQIENLNGHSKADWLGWEPIPPLEGDPRSGTIQGGSPDYEPSGTGWRGTQRSCYGAYWNDNLADPNRPVSVGNAPSWWYRAAPTINNAASNDCAVCPEIGILPLHTVKQDIKDVIDSLEPEGTTNIPQGLAWAWEVLMPGVPFTEAVETVPFPRQRAIVLLTDGENHGGNGDAYKGRFGAGTAAGTTTNSAHGYLPSPPDAPNTRNNLNNRLKRLAANIKAQGITLYVIQFNEDSATLEALLKSVATQPNAPYYYNAPTVAELQAAFKQIAADLSRLRLSK